MAGQQPGDEQWDDVVARLDEDTARRLLIGAAERNEDVARAVRLAAADSATRLSVLRTEVDRGLRTRRFLDYWQSSAWAFSAVPVIDALRDAVESEPSAELVALLERAVGHVIKVILRADDSNGSIGSLARDLLELHERACDAGVADPKALAKWMIRFNFDDQDFFVADPVRYATALGEVGVASFRREVAKRGVEAPSFASRHSVERLAVLDGDVDQIVALLGGDLSTPYQFIRVAEAMREIGRDDEALEWAGRGIDTTTGWQVAKLYELTSEILVERGDTAGVLATRRAHHERMPTSSTYAAFKAAAEATDGWSAEVEGARAVLGERDRGGLVDALLGEGDSEAAWEVAASGPDWDAGERRWQRLAEAREKADPTAAFAIYLLLADTALATADRGHYQVAARRLKAARRAAASAGLEVEFEAHVLGLREKHRRRPTLIAILDKASLP